MSMRLLILGLLMESNKHPYEIRQTIKARNWNETFKLRDGSLYYAVDQLREDGLIEAAEVVPVPGENRPDKTIFRITDAGRAAFQELLNEQFGQCSFPQHSVFLGLPFVWHGEQEQVIPLIEKQLDHCEARIERLQGVLDLKRAFLPVGSSMMIQGIIQFSETERLWLLQLLESARSGELFEGPKWTPEQQDAYKVIMEEMQKKKK